MKTGWIILILVGFAAYGFGCGKPDAMDPEGMINVNGNAVFGSQCPYGSLSDPVPARVYLWDCPLGLKTVDLAQALRPIVLQADCKKKLIIARTLDGAMDTTWEVMPDGNFSFTVDGGYAVLKNDGRGNTDCSVRLATELTGRLECGDRDKVKIHVESVWWLDKEAPKPTGSPSPNPTRTQPGPFPTPTLTPEPTLTPTPIPTGTITPTPTPTITLVPTPTPTLTNGPRPTPTLTPGPTVTVTPRPAAESLIELLVQTPATGGAPTASKCAVPKGCYFFASAQVNQCE